MTIQMCFCVAKVYPHICAEACFSFKGFLLMSANFMKRPKATMCWFIPQYFSTSPVRLWHSATSPFISSEDKSLSMKKGGLQMFTLFIKKKKKKGLCSFLKTAGHCRFQDIGLKKQTVNLLKTIFGCELIHIWCPYEYL